MTQTDSGIEIKTYHRAAVPTYAPCQGCGTKAVHVLTDGNDHWICRSCATKAALAAYSRQFVPAPKGSECEKKHGIFSPAIQRDTRTDTLLCANCYDRIIEAMTRGIAD